MYRAAATATNVPTLAPKFDPFSMPELLCGLAWLLTTSAYVRPEQRGTQQTG